ncbi:unnamed protein product [Cylindrotheca closterium]|nr:unnamed protein product [Cylindrotheca closterium]
MDLTTSLRVASLALRKYEKEIPTDEKEENGRQVIIAFVGSPLNEDDDNLEQVGRILKRNATELIIVALGDDTDDKLLQDLVSIANGKVVKISPQDVAKEALDGLFGTSHTPPETTDSIPIDGPTMMKKEIKNENASHRIDALLNRSREERGKIQLMLKTSFSSEAIPPPPGMMHKDLTFAQGSLDSKFDDSNPIDNRDYEDEEDGIPSPASSEKGFSQWEEEQPFDEREELLQATLDCGPEIIPLQPTISASTSTRQKPNLTIQVNGSRDQADTYDLVKEHNVELERHMSMSPTSGGPDLQQEQENIARFANLRQTHVSIAEYERVKTELRAAKRYIRVLQRLVHEKDEMISALHDMLGCLRSQNFELGIIVEKKSEVTTLTLDGDTTDNEDESLHGISTDSNTSRWKSKTLVDELDDQYDLKPSQSSDSHISINEIRKRTRELEALHASLTNKSKALESMALMKSNKSQTLTEKRNKKRELEALRASIISAS